MREKDRSAAFDLTNIPTEACSDRVAIGMASGDYPQLKGCRGLQAFAAVNFVYGLFVTCGAFVCDFKCPSLLVRCSIASPQQTRLRVL
jgi:hypothetical protein